jgi:hypothetical protein
MSDRVSGLWALLQTNRATTKQNASTQDAASVDVLVHSTPSFCTAHRFSADAQHGIWD